MNKLSERYYGNVSNGTVCEDILVRKSVHQDMPKILNLLNKTVQFSDEERQCALELFNIYLTQGEKGGYDFLTAETNEKVFIGYICFGRIPLTDACYDIYWIVVEPEFQNKGSGSRLVESAEAQLRNEGARKIFIETSGLPRYASAQNFYRKQGFELLASVNDFYRVGDSKLLFVKDLARS